MGDLLTFRRMVTTVIVQLLFWIGVFASVAVGAILILYGTDGLAETGIDVDGLFGVTEEGGLTDVVLGILILTAGPLIVRIICELLILFFRMNESLTDIRNNLRTMPDVIAARGAATQQTQPIPPIATTGNGGDPDERINAVRAEMNRQLADLRQEMRETLAGIRHALHEETRSGDRERG